MSKKIEKEELIKIIQYIYCKYGFFATSLMKKEDNMPNRNVFARKFGSLDNALITAGIDLEENQKNINNKLLGRNLIFSDKDLLNKLIDFNNKYGFPTSRKIKNNKDFPTDEVYRKRFGSFKNAILLSGLKIPKEREKYFNREKLSEKEMLFLLKYYTNEKLKNNIYLLTAKEIDNIENMPHSSTYINRFDGIPNAYELINIDYEEFNTKALEKDMLEEYLELCNKLEHTADSREIDKASLQNMCYCSSAYIRHFGNISDLQKRCGFTPTMLGRNTSKEEALEGLRVLAKEINRIPLQRDVDNCLYLPSANYYYDKFGGITNAIKMAGFKDVEGTGFYITPKGNRALSSYEYDFLLMLEYYDIPFEKEEYYSSYILGYKRKHRFDFTVTMNNKKYFIEIFGLMERENYRQKTERKIQLCKINNLPLIDLYKEDFLCNNSKEKLYNLLLDKIKQIQLNTK